MRGHDSYIYPEKNAGICKTNLLKYTRDLFGWDYLHVDIWDKKNRNICLYRILGKILLSDIETVYVMRMPMLMMNMRIDLLEWGIVRGKSKNVDPIVLSSVKEDRFL